jgi:hypothetical protein
MSYEQLLLDSDLAANYPLNEKLSPFAPVDITGNANHFTPGRTTWESIAGPSSWLPTAIRCTGTSNTFWSRDALRFDPTSNSFSMCLWVRPAATAVNDRTMQMSMDPNTVGVMMGSRSAGSFGMRINSNASAETTSSFLVTAETWSHCAFVWNQTQLLGYRNAQVQSFAGDPALSPRPTINIFRAFGADNSSPNGYAFSQFMLFRRVLSAAEVQAIYLGPTTGTKSHPLAAMGHPLS